MGGTSSRLEGREKGNVGVASKRFSDFRSDTVTRPTPAMRAAMLAAEVGDDVFGDDPTVNALQEHAARMLGFEAALFLPSGTQANLSAVMSHCQRGDEAIVGQQWHTYRWEAGGMAVLGSVQPQPLENQPDGTLRLEEIEGAIKADDPHFARTRLVVLENTTGGRVLSLSYLRQVRALALGRGLAMHLDGARLFNAAVKISQDAGGTPQQAAREIASCFDSVSMCLSKGLGAPVGSLLLGGRDFIGRARRIRKMLGGAMRQAGILAAAGLHALEHHVERLAEDHENAAALHAGLAEAVAANDGLRGRVRLQPAQTNMLFTEVDAELAGALLDHLAADGVQVTCRRAGRVAHLRWVTHLDVDRSDVERAARGVREFRG
jgi:threonine aldolase